MFRTELVLVTRLSRVGTNMGAGFCGSVLSHRERSLYPREMAVARMRASGNRGKGRGGGGERKRTGGSMSSWFFEQISASKD